MWGVCCCGRELPAVGPRSAGRARLKGRYVPRAETRNYVENKPRLAGQPGSEPRSPASWPKVGLKPLAVADPPPSAKPCCSPAFNYKKGPARGGSMARGGAAQACARVVPRLAADVVVREGAQWCTLMSQLVFRSVCEWSGVFFRVSSTLGEGDN